MWFEAAKLGIPSFKRSSRRYLLSHLSVHGRQALGRTGEATDEEAQLYLQFGALLGESAEETADTLQQRGGDKPQAVATAIRRILPRRAKGPCAALGCLATHALGTRPAQHAHSSARVALHVFVSSFETSWVLWHLPAGSAKPVGCCWG